MVAILLTCAALASATDGQCAQLGCTAHKEASRQCQCNVHCTAHHDCCSDFEAACLNATSSAPAQSSEKGSSDKSHAPSSPHHAPSSPHHAPSSPHTPHNPKSAGGKGSDSSGCGSSGSNGGKGSSGNKPEHEQHTHNSSPTSPKSAGDKGSDSSSSGSSGGKGSSSSKAGNEQHSKAHEHSKRQPVSSTSIMIVVLACITGITVPVTVSIVLVLRSRGVCCVSSTSAVHQRIDRPPTKPTDVAIDSPASLRQDLSGTAAPSAASPASEA